ncbi:uncharacterized protein LOC127265347 [Andrographis paniculata]|uniref:uncharacterized protein LOC127265347 n=1 Tax=Andrographis paniculata TaxID=175694 RepID=UPI0021E865CE|nr:uncharacterized protein LOC127265347 [Andrographis paniculata]
MDRKHGFFASLKEEVIRGLSPARSTSARSPSPSPSSSSSSSRRRRKGSGGGAIRPGVETLSPLPEGPDPTAGSDSDDPRSDGWAHWLCRAPVSNSAAGSPEYSRSNLRLLLGVLGAPLAPVHVSTNDPLPHLCIKDTPIESSSAQYILQQYVAASGGAKVQAAIQKAYATGKVKMSASDIETPTKVIKKKQSSRSSESGGFVLWQMSPNMWYVELAIAASKIHAGCNGSLVWRHTPWLGAHAAKGPVRPLRRTLQGLDPWTTASMFVNARCTGEKKIDGEDCFVLKIGADGQTLKARSEGPAEIIRHVLFGYFSQKTGLLVHLEDSHLTRIQTAAGEAVYWETTINSFLDDYRPVDGVMIAHSGRSLVTLFRFGDTAMTHTKTTMEETWTIEEVAFNVAGVSPDCFIPPAELRFDSVDGEL